MKWVPNRGMWLTYLKVDAKAGELTYDLALNVNGGAPSAIDAGLSAPSVAPPASAPPTAVWAVGIGALLMFGLVFLAGRERRSGSRVAV